MKRKNKILISAIAIFVLVVLGYITFYSTYASQTEIIKKALYLEKRYDEDLLSSVKNFLQGNSGVSRNFRLDCSPNSFSYFFITLKAGVPKDYELQYVPSQKLAYELEINLRKHNSVFSLADITEQKWNWEGKKFNGSFSFKTTFGLQGRCIFEGQNKTIQKLVIAKKGSDKLEDGYAVFGCKYGLNALAEEIYDEAVSLPESKRGQYITYKNYNPNSLIISMRKNGDINVNGRIISLSILDEVLKNAQKQFIGSPFSVFLRIDKDCPQGNATQLIELIKPYHFKIYQVFNKEGEYYPIAKQISPVFIDGTRVEKMSERGEVKCVRNETRNHTKPRSHREK